MDARTIIVACLLAGPFVLNAVLCVRLALR